MILRRGNVVLANLPYSDQTGSKIRPALVVQCDRNNGRLDDVILVMITGVVGRATTASKTDEIAPAISAGNRAAPSAAAKTLRCSTAMRRRTSQLLAIASPAAGNDAAPSSATCAQLALVAGLLPGFQGFKLGISEITAKAHLGKVMAKMNADSFTDLVMMAAKLGAEPPPKERAACAIRRYRG